MAARRIRLGQRKDRNVSALAGAGAHVTSTVTSEGALLSATSKKDAAKDPTGGLLRKIGSAGVLVIKDLTSILSMNRDTRASVLAALREVYDGRWERNVGTDGGRTLTWEGRIVLIGAVTTAYDSAHGVIAAMGDRFALVRVDSHLGRMDSGRQALRNVGHEEQMRAELSDAACAVLSGLDPDRADLSEDTRDVLLAAADLVTLSRTAVERDQRGDVLEAHAPEAPTRFTKMLGQLVRGSQALGLDHGLDIALRVAGDSVPPVHLLVLGDVLANPSIRTTEVTKRLQRPRTSVDRTLQELHLLGLVIVEEVGDGQGWGYSLAPEVDRDALRMLTGRGVTRKVTTPGVGVQEVASHPPTDIPGDGPTTASASGDAPDCECGWQLEPGSHYLSCDLRTPA